MASCSISGWGVDRTYTLTVTESSYNAKTNTSVVKWVLSASGSSTKYDYYLWASVNGTNIYNESGSWSKMAFPAATGSTSGTMTITHNSGGDKSISFYVEGYAYQYSTKSASGSLTLTKLDRTAPTITAGNATNITINSFKIAGSAKVGSAATTCSQWAYRIKKSGGSYGSWVYNNTSGSGITFTVGSLTQNTSYVVQLAGKRSVNDIWGYSAEKTVKTLGASSITSVTNVTLNYNSAASCTVKFTPLVSSFKYKVGFDVGGHKWWSNYITPGNTNPYTYVDSNFTVSLANYIKSASSATCTCYLNTYDANNNQVGSTNSKTFTVTVPSTMVPVINDITISEGNPVSGFGRFAKNLSKAQVIVKADGVYSSTISNVYVTVLGITYTASKVTDSGTNKVSYIATTNALTATGEQSVSVRVVDSRSKEVTDNTNSITIYDYFPPTGSYKIQTIGTTISVTLDGKVASVDNQNDFHVVMTRTKVDDPSDTETVTFYPSTWEFTQNWLQTVADASTATYIFDVSIIDEKNTWSESQKTAIITISRLRGGRGVTFFGEAQKEGFYIVDSAGNDIKHSIDLSEYAYCAKYLAEDYSASTIYYLGQFSIYNSKVWECIYPMTAAEAWNSSHWRELGDV